MHHNTQEGFMVWFSNGGLSLEPFHKTQLSTSSEVFIRKVLMQYIWNNKDKGAGADLGGGLWGGGGGRTPSPQEFEPLPTQRVPPLVLFKKSIFGLPTLKFF